MDKAIELTQNKEAVSQRIIEQHHEPTLKERKKM